MLRLHVFLYTVFSCGAFAFTALLCSATDRILFRGSLHLKLSCSFPMRTAQWSGSRRRARSNTWSWYSAGDRIAFSSERAALLLSFAFIPMERVLNASPTMPRLMTKRLFPRREKSCSSQHVQRASPTFGFSTLLRTEPRRSLLDRVETADLLGHPTGSGSPLPRTAVAAFHWRRADGNISN